MPKNVFAKTFADTWQETNPEIIIKCFKKSGIYSFNRNVVPVDKFKSEAYKRYLKKKAEHSQGLLDPRNPKSLKELCVLVFNDEFYSSEAPNHAGKEVSTLSQNDFGSEYVTFLSQLSKKDYTCQPFVVNDASDSLKCL
ncbi:unnamed protein product [Parnassius apollo]|uniref:(apollo) hypothetical protein n=1 Tax=Parnassius apollo TaxID=110799 RepID=A0A8S3XKJ1_PARAO|nr:unnamed protein product [Parnassius apollo]